MATKTNKTCVIHIITTSCASVLIYVCVCCACSAVISIYSGHPFPRFLRLHRLRLDFGGCTLLCQSTVRTCALLRWLQPTRNQTPEQTAENRNDSHGITCEVDSYSTKTRQLVIHRSKALIGHVWTGLCSFSCVRLTSCCFLNPAQSIQTDTHHCDAMIRLFFFQLVSSISVNVLMEFSKHSVFIL